MKPCPTYKAIQMFVVQHYGYAVETCWIADVKKSLGYPVRAAWNRQGAASVKPCPAAKRPSIEHAIKKA